jgi:hypothetical protein
MHAGRTMRRRLFVAHPAARRGQRRAPDPTRPRPGRRARLEAAGFLSHRGLPVHPHDLALRDAGLTGSYALAAMLGRRKREPAWTTTAGADDLVYPGARLRRLLAPRGRARDRRGAPARCRSGRRRSRGSPRSRPGRRGVPARITSTGSPKGRGAALERRLGLTRIGR